jgi:hypothetical protein
MHTSVGRWQMTGAADHVRRGRRRSGTAGVYISLGIFSACAALAAGPNALPRNGTGLAGAAPAQPGSMLPQRTTAEANYSGIQRAAPGYSGRRRLQSGAATCTGISGVGTSADQAACAAVTGTDLADDAACLGVVTAGGNNACAYVAGTVTAPAPTPVTAPAPPAVLARPGG